ncbi:unnamed protein product [Allacma fusca]|uniref:Uncharacterized protein n=1 Tax=Allacma fusca TaxID=39272 RepID=A0A8J2JWP2_9HEXA|nr:unnamed protein product [Allacma fusca]
MVSCQLQPVRKRNKETVTGRRVGAAIRQNKSQSELSAAEEDSQNDPNRRRGNHLVHSPMVCVYRSFNIGGMQYNTESSKENEANSFCSFEFLMKMILCFILLMLFGFIVRIYTGAYYGFFQ